MSWDLTVWELGLVSGWAALTGGALAALIARQKQLIPVPVPQPAKKNQRGEVEPVEPNSER